MDTNTLRDPRLNHVLTTLSKRPFAVIGHRGAPSIAPENTISSFLKAIEAGADLVELDVQVTLDGIPIALHDEDLVRVAGININARKSRFNDLREISVGGEKIPSLEEVLRLVTDKVGILIEIKVPGDENVVIDTVKMVGVEEKIAIISFYEEALANVKRRSPNVPCGIIYTQPPGKILKAKMAGFEMVVPRYPLATKKAVDLAHRMGIKVVVWTVNDEKLVAEMASRGVDGITTDYPSMVVKIRSSLIEGRQGLNI